MEGFTVTFTMTNSHFDKYQCKDYNFAHPKLLNSAWRKRGKKVPTPICINNQQNKTVNVRILVNMGQ
jgi:hypothetical protein